MAGFEKIKSALHQDGITYGASRLALGPNQTHQRDCVYCGKCLYGCPYGVIYNSAQEVGQLRTQASDAFDYRPNVIVDRISQTHGGATVIGHDRLSEEPVQFEGERVFLAAGVIPSSRIALKSLGAYDRPVPIHDSQYFILPLLSASGQSEAPREALHTLSQLFLEIEDHKISPYTIHLQLYTYNDIIPKVLREKLWFAPGLRELLVQPLSHRLLVIQGYLHSAHSGTMSLRLTRDRGTGKERLIVQGQPNTKTKKIIDQVAKKLSRHFLKLGLMPISKAGDITLPGRGFHSGGSFPMKSQPKAFESDRYGRVPGMSRLHLVDASVFPSIPATTITLTAMANAHRIGSTWKQGL
jgi:choline dehydrogenase-like flavoprotein